MLHCYRSGYQAIFCDIGYQGAGGYHPLRGWLPPPRFNVWFKILYRVIQRLIQQCFLSKLVYLNVKYAIATRNYEFFNTGTAWSVMNERLCYSTETTMGDG